MSKALFGETVEESKQQMTPEMAAEILMVPPVFEEIAALRTNYAIQEYTLGEIFAAEDAGEMSSEEADELAAQAIADHTENQSEILGVELGMDEEVEVEYSNTGSTADFAASFGETLAALLDAEYEDANDGIDDVAAASGLTPEEVVGMISGQVAPDLSAGMQPLEAIAGVFDHLQNDEQAYQEFLQLGGSAYQQVAGEQPVAAMSSADHSLRAEFAALQEREMIGESLRNLERECDRGCGEAWLTPHESRILLGQFEERGDRVAAFSQACEATQTPPTTQLDRINYYLYVAEQRGSLALFNNAVDTFVDEENEVTELTQSTATDYRSRNGYQ